MILAQAWERVAGATLAARARATRVRRGVLEVEVEPGPWSATLSDLLPRLAGRLALARPELRVRACRCVRPDSSVREAARPLELEEPPAASAATSVAPPTQRSTRASADERPLDQRLRQLARRYLERRGGQSQ
jgi:hypothetical protein